MARRTRQKGERSALYERFSQLYDTFMTDVDYESWADYLCRLYARGGKGLKLPGSPFERKKQKPLRLFDGACGTGGVTIPLAVRGYAAAGGDLSGQMLAFAAEKARKQGVTVPFVRQDLRTLAVPRPVDVVNCSCDGVNYLLSAEEVRAFFRAAREALKPGGLLCFDVSSRWKLETILAGNIFGENAEKAAYLWRNAYDEEQRLLEMELTFFLSEDGKVFERTQEIHVQRAHEQAELTKWLEECGFENIEVFGAFTFEAPKSTDERLQFLAVRP